MDSQTVIAFYKALYPKELLKQYSQGKRNFAAINLLRGELEGVIQGTSAEGTDYQASISLVNPLWLDFLQKVEQRFEWDWYGRFIGNGYTEIAPKKLSGVDLNGINLRGSYLYLVDLAHSNLSRANLRNTQLFDANLAGADLSRADLRDANLSGANLQGCNLYMARLDRAILSHTDLRQANLQRAKLTKTVFSGADLREADLSKAHLAATQLNQANLVGINLVEVNLRNANVTGATISATQQADFLSALSIRVVQSQ